MMMVWGGGDGEQGNFQRNPLDNSNLLDLFVV